MLQRRERHRPGQAHAGRVGSQRVTIVGTFLTAPLRTVRDSFPSYGSPVLLHSWGWLAGVNLSMTFMTKHQCFALA